MLRMAAAGAIALLVTGSPAVYGQSTSATEAAGGSAEQSTADEAATLTDARVEIVKAALQLTPDQQKYWPPIEDAIRARAKNRQERLASAMQRAEQRQDRGPVEALRNRDPVQFLHRRADALAQRSADLKKLADAWQPLYQTLSADQKRRLGFLTMSVLRELRSGAEQRRLQALDTD